MLICKAHVFSAEIGQWLPAQPNGDQPTPREGHAAGLADKSLYIFGGCARVDADDADDVYFDDLYRLDTGERN